MAAHTELLLRGPRARFRGKVNRPIAIKLTPDGHAALTEGTSRTGLSRPDYIELLLRRAAVRHRRRPRLHVETK